MRSPQVLKLILENTSTDRIAGAVDSSPSRVRAWLKACGLLPERAAPREVGRMAGRIGAVQRAQDGQTYGFVVYDAQDRACVFLGYPTWHQADTPPGMSRGCW